MLSLRKLMAKLPRHQGRWEGLIRGLSRATTQDSPTAGTHLDEVTAFGTNPGNLRMFRYLPSKLAADPALVVVLHGCTQTAAGYDLVAGWSTLADRYGFALLMPEQQRSNNPNGCFNWFQPGDIERGRGEALSIRQMIEKMITDTGVDRSRVFVTGLSAGGAMTSVMLACYPEVFAGGAIIAGLPYGAATNVQQAYESMFQSPTRSAREWGDLVRAAATHDGPWPRISIWHGSADRTVIPNNALEILKQWTDIHGLLLRPSVEQTVDGYPRQAWMNEAEEELIESYTITQMGHGTPLATGQADGRCGAPGPFLLEVGISSSYHIAKFFGLAHPGESPRAHLKTITIAPEQLVPHAEPIRAQPLRLTGDLPDEKLEPASQGSNIPRIDIGAFITRALTAAGLMKDR